jgi:hypothetical protein
VIVINGVIIMLVVEGFVGIDDSRCADSITTTTTTTATSSSEITTTSTNVDDLIE